MHSRNRAHFLFVLFAPTTKNLLFRLEMSKILLYYDNMINRRRGGSWQFFLDEKTEEKFAYVKTFSYLCTKKNKSI